MAVAVAAAIAIAIAVDVEEFLDRDTHESRHQLIALPVVGDAEVRSRIVDSVFECDDELFWRECSHFGEGANFSNQPALLTARFGLIHIALQCFPQYWKL